MCEVEYARDRARRRSVRHRRRLGRGALRASRRGAWRAGRDRRGRPLGWHVRDPRLRAEEAAGLRERGQPHARGRARAGLDDRRPEVRLARADRREGQGDRAAVGGVRGAAAQGGVPAGGGARAARRRAHVELDDGERVIGGEHPGRDRRTAAAAGCGRGSRRTRRSTSPALPERIAVLGARLHRGRVRAHLRRLRRPRDARAPVARAARLRPGPGGRGRARAGGARHRRCVEAHVHGRGPELRDGRDRPRPGERRARARGDRRRARRARARSWSTSSRGRACRTSTRSAT